MEKEKKLQKNIKLLSKNQITNMKNTSLVIVALPSEWTKNEKGKVMEPTIEELRQIAIISLVIFHLIIMSSLSIGLFSQTMIVSFILLLDGKFIDSIKSSTSDNEKFLEKPKFL